MNYKQAKEMAYVLEKMGHIARVVKMPNGMYELNVTHLK